MASKRCTLPAFLLGGLLLIAADRGVRAAPSVHIEVATFETLDKGKPAGTLISTDGEILVGADARKLPIPEALLYWSRAEATDGTVYFGTGDGAQIIAVTEKSGRTIATFETAILVTALAIGPGNTLFAATMPDARILEVDRQTGAWQELTRLDAGHIWDLVYDPQKNRVYAATGAPGKIYRIALGQRSAPEVTYDAGEQHLLTLALDGQGQLLAGGSEKAVLYRIEATGRARALHDFGGNELRKIALGPDGAVYVAVNTFKQKTSGMPRFGRPDPSANAAPSKPGAAVPAPTPRRGKFDAAEVRPGAEEGTGALYVMDADGRVEQLHALDKGYLTDVAVDRAGRVWTGDGSEGRVWRIDPGQRTTVTVFDFDERQVLTLAVSGAQMLIGTGDPGTVYRVTFPSKTPRYISHVLDGKFLSTWGNVVLSALGDVAVATRSGNSVSPDATWSAWTRVSLKGNSGMIRSPTARYLQARFTFQQPHAQSVLRRFDVYYRPQNQRARITELTVGSPPAAEKEKATQRNRSRKVTLQWKVDNPDADPLRYMVYYREELGQTWRVLTEKPLTEPKFSWNIGLVPDDVYQVKVVASDDAANSPEHALSDERISPPILVDNRPPEIIGLTVRFPWVTGTARDTTSVIRRIDYAIDGGPWVIVDPLDGVLDSPVERFRIRLPQDLAPGLHTIVVRAEDAAGNITLARLRFSR